MTCDDENQISDLGSSGTSQEERIATILAATGRSIARNGVNGTTLEKVAAESGMSRSHIRHYVGNRADLIALFRTRILQRYAPPSLADAEVTGISATEYALNFLFDHEVDLDEYAAIDAIVAAARHDESLYADVHAAYARTEAFLIEAIKADHPQWSPQQVETTAAQVLMLAYGHATLVTVGLASAQLGGARTLAARLMELPSH